MKIDRTIKFAYRKVSVSMPVNEWTDIVKILVAFSSDAHITVERRDKTLTSAERITASVENLRRQIFDDISEPGDPDYRQGGFHEVTK